MFLNPTTFILGAGASWHYGYPTGEGLVEEVAQKAQIAGQYFREHMQQISFVPEIVQERIAHETPLKRREAWTEVYRECEEFESRLLAANPPVIDYFLGFNPHLEKIGKLLIAWVILEREKRSQAEGNVNRSRQERIDAHKKDGWYRFLLSRLTNGCRTSEDVLKNNVKFVTFNYDHSLEKELLKGLGAMAMFTQEDIASFMGSDRILHVYGDIGEQSLPTTSPYGSDIESSRRYAQNPNAKMQDWKLLLDVAYSASKGIRTIDPHEKEDNKGVLEKAAKHIGDASRVCILGFGFDEENCKRLQLEKSLRRVPANSSAKSIFFTNKDDINTVNKAASKIFAGTLSFMPPGTYFVGDPDKGWYFEKSIRNCYEAWALDFGLI